MPDRKPDHVSICVCTFRRPQLLERLLENLALQVTSPAFEFSIVIADNDAAKSAQATVEEFARRSPVPVAYCAEPRQNIALARNCAIAQASGNYIAFLDDDEFPAEDWLVRLYTACQEYGCAGVLGPVRPHFESPPPAWIIRGRFCERPEPATGTVMHWNDCRTGNVLFRRDTLPPGEPPFAVEFGTGGEDKDFFMRATGRGAVFVWCNEAPVYETVPPSRWRRSYMLRRALLRGKNILKHPEGRIQVVLTSLVAAPLYSLLLPFTLFFGQHRFMKYCIKWCDHVGRLLALVGLNRINDRQT
jgi:succinoglycan biosynthesis protein ExoM